MQIIVSAPGKIHLIGEHAVVYGKPALLASLDKRLYAKIKSQNSKVKTQKSNELIINSKEKSNLILLAVNIFKKAFGVKKLPPLEITITSQVPIGSGLGSSAALSAAVIGALMKYVKNIWNPGKINELSYESEKIAHGNPSGADNSTVVFGGLVWFRREFDFLKSIWNLPISSYKIPRLYLIDSGRPKESTRVMVEQVRRLYEKRGKKIEEVFNDQEKQTKRLLLALRHGKPGEFTDAVRSAERNLEKMEVVGDKAKKIIRWIEYIGGAAKVTGAGGKKEGSGMILCYHQNSGLLLKLEGKLQSRFIPVVLGEEGIRIENNSITH